MATIHKCKSYTKQKKLHTAVMSNGSCHSKQPPFLSFILFYYDLNRIQIILSLHFSRKLANSHSIHAHLLTHAHIRARTHMHTHVTPPPPHTQTHLTGSPYLHTQMQVIHRAKKVAHSSHFKWQLPFKTTVISFIPPTTHTHLIGSPHFSRKKSRSPLWAAAMDSHVLLSFVHAYFHDTGWLRLVGS